MELAPGAVFFFLVFLSGSFLFFFGRSALFVSASVLGHFDRPSNVAIVGHFGGELFHSEAHQVGRHATQRNEEKNPSQPAETL